MKRERSLAANADQKNGARTYTCLVLGLAGGRPLAPLQIYAFDPTAREHTDSRIIIALISTSSPDTVHDGTVGSSFDGQFIGIEDNDGLRFTDLIASNLPAASLSQG